MIGAVLNEQIRIMPPVVAVPKQVSKHQDQVVGRRWEAMHPSYRSSNCPKCSRHSQELEILADRAL
jgi:hypothetical protein